MDHKDIKIVRERLSNYQSPLDKDKAWAAFSTKSSIHWSKLFLIKSLVVITVAALLGVSMFTIWPNEKLELKNNDSLLNEATVPSTTSPSASTIERIKNTKIITSEQSAPQYKTSQTANNMLLKKARRSTERNEAVENSYSNPIHYYSTETLLSNNVTEIDKTAKTPKFVRDTVAESENKIPQTLDTIPSMTLTNRNQSAQLIDSALTSLPTSVNDTQQTSLTPRYSPRHTVFLAYNVGVREFGGLSLNGANNMSSAPSTTGTGWRPHGHQSTVLGYEYAIRPKINLHGAVSYGFGYLNGKQGFSYSGSSGSGGETTITVKQQEWGAEIAGIATILQYKKLKTEAGIGASARTFTLKYTAGPNTTLTGINGTLNPGESSTYNDHSIVALGLVRLNYQLPITNLAFRLTGIYQLGEFARHSIRGGLSYTFFKKQHNE
jgi:hypothetical protein